MSGPLTAEDCYRALGEHHLQCEVCAPGGWPVVYRAKCAKGQAIFRSWKELSGKPFGWFDGPA